MNKIFLTGHLTKKPELRYTERDMAICHFSIAVNKFVKGGQKTIFVNIVTFSKTAENCEKYLDKGSKVAIIGELEIRQYKDNEGNNRYMTEVLANEVEFLSSKPQAETEETYTEMDIEDGDLPF